MMTVAIFQSFNNQSFNDPELNERALFAKIPRISEISDLISTSSTNFLFLNS